MKSMKALQFATVKKTSLFVSLNTAGHTTLKYFNELQSLSAKNDRNRFSCNDPSYCNEISEVFDCKVIETGYRYLISVICMLLLASKIFQQIIIVIIEEFFEE